MRDEVCLSPKSSSETIESRDTRLSVENLFDRMLAELLEQKA